MSETKSKGDLRYIFSADKPTHTDLIDAVTSNVVYKVTPDYEGRKIVTKIRNASGDTIASLEWKDTLPDIVTYKQEPPRRVSSWLKPKSLLNPYDHLEFKDEQRRGYYWKRPKEKNADSEDSRPVEMALYTADDPQAPIATFMRAKDTEPAELVITGRAQEILDLCVATFLFQEKKRRTKIDKSAVIADSGRSLPTAILIGLFTSSPSIA